MAGVIGGLIGSTASAPSVTVEYLVIAGGGGGGSYVASAGGGAGGYRSSATGESSGGGASAENILTLPILTNYTVTVGAGGAGQISSTQSVNGSNSIFGNITSNGGGGGGGYTGSFYAGKNGGSGGGGSYAASAGFGNGGTGTENQGFAGGTGQNSNAEGGGGGGGAAAVGGNAVPGSSAGSGGSGINSYITGYPFTRAGGGGASWYPSGTFGLGGAGGGGNGVSGTGTGVSGAQNTGGGGGGSGTTAIPPNINGGNGGSGVVILKYPNTFTLNLGSGLTATTINASNYKFTQFTAGTGTISFSQSAAPAAPRYWRYIEGSAIVSHHPRVSRIDLIDGALNATRLITYTSDNCSDSGSYQPGTVSLDLGAGNEKWFVNARTYSVFSGARSSNFTVQYSYNNSTWQTAFSGIMANYNLPNQSSASCGLFFGNIG